ncbi:DUF4998 domain-containing protein [Parapedobacter sp. 10938]|uniref:DUF4998 domain-containing protein n=1 Tax=Parapedobacter flavus TaxID=3110225 RepID=UPI002DB57EB0|nr:DUF4998 domain-containing protein [Parapedobacter sp. 10938]MEC3878497.1 DUF4998 domain-containing protein [Parapedobacter sp. 10938]
MNTNCQSLRLFVCLIIAIVMASCGKMDALYSDFLEEGEFIYPGKADSLRAHPGYNRIQLSWIVLADPNATNAVIYWDNRADSLEVDLGQVARPDTMRVILNDMEEKAYTFQVVTRDEKGNLSVTSEVLGTVYGDVYQNSLLTRAVRNLSVTKDTLVIDWVSSDETSVGDSLVYQDKEGRINRLFVPPSDDTTKLPLYAPDYNFVHWTMFLPDSLAIDTFVTADFEVVVDPDLFGGEVELNKSLFAQVELPTDTYEPNSGSSTMEHIWDGTLNKESPTFITKTSGDMPQWFTFDLGVTTELTRMQINQRGTKTNGRLYAGGNVRTAEIWGSADPNPDGSWDSWILLGTFESVKPSGEGPLTAEDIDHALAGEMVTFGEDLPPVRYIRFKTLSNWDSQNRGYINIAQLTFWGLEN